MRKAKALEILTAAIAAVPGTLLMADDSTVPNRRQTSDFSLRNDWQHVNQFTLSNSGKYALYRPPLGGGPDVDTNQTWIGANDATWNVNTNWTGGLIPDGPNAVANITELNDGGTIVVPTTGIALSTLNISDPQIAGIGGTVAGGTGVINFTNASGIGNINVTNFATQAFPFTGRFFGTALGIPAGSATPARPLVLAGASNGMNYTGSGPVSLRTNNTYTGATTISGGGYVTVLAPGTADGVFGSNSTINLNNGEIWIEIDNATLSKSIVVQAGGATLSLGTDPGNAGTSTHTISSSFTGGAGTNLVIDNTFGGNGVFTNNTPSFTGNLRFTGLGTNILQGTVFSTASSIRSSGTTEFAGAGNRLPDGVTIQQHGGGIRTNNLAETIGGLNVVNGTPAIIGGGLTITNYTRGAGTGLEVRANGLGSGNNVLIGNGLTPAILSNGIIKFAYGSSADPFTSGAESNLTELVTYNAVTGVTPLGTYSENTFTAGTNVRLQSNTVDQAFPAPAVTINSLVLAPGFDGNGNGVNGVTVSGGPITVTSGTVLSATSGFTPANAINSGLGNIINSNLAFGGNEAVLLTPGALSINGVISGTGGLTKAGGRTLFMNGLSTYTGTTILTSFNRHKGDILSGAAGPYGMDTSPIILAPSDRTQQDPQLGATSIPFVSFGPDAGQGATTMTRALTLRAGGNGQLISGLIRNASGAAFNMNGPINLEADTDMVLQGLFTANDIFNVNGVVSGAGHLSLGPAAGFGATATITGNNTFTGGFDQAGGNLIVNHDNALGTGMYVVSGGTANNISSTAGPRTIANTVLVAPAAGGSWVIGNGFTFSGTTIIQTPNALINVAAGNVTTFSGNSISQSSIFKEGDGEMHLSGNNVAFHGQLNVGNGTTPGGMIVLRSNNSVGSSVGVTAQNNGANTVGLTGGINVGTPNAALGTNGELGVMRGEGIGGLGGFRNLSGNNTWTGNMTVQEQTGLTTKGSIGVDGAGDTMTVTGAVFTSATNTSGLPAVPLTFKKTGPGLLVIGRDTFQGTTPFRGSVQTSGAFEIAQGRVRFSNQGTPPGNNLPSVADVASIVFPGGPAAPSTQLNMGRNAMVVDYTGGTPLADLQTLINVGRAGGLWTGNGIMSSDLAGLDQTKVNLFAFDTATTGDGANGAFLGDPIDNTAVLVFPALRGDANLDWRVNTADFDILAGNFNQNDRLWTQGNFNGDGVVNNSDFDILASNFNFAAGPDGPTAEDWQTLYNHLVPEPSSLVLVGLSGLAMLKRQRRSR